MERMEHPLSEEKDASTSGSGSLASSSTEVMKDIDSAWTNTEDVKEGHLDRSVDDHSPTPGSQPTCSPPRSNSHEAGFKLVFVLVDLQIRQSAHRVKVIPGWLQRQMDEEVIVCTRGRNAVYWMKKSDARSRQNQRQSYGKLGYGSRVCSAQIRQCERARGRSSKKSQRNIGQGSATVPRSKKWCRKD